MRVALVSLAALLVLAAPASAQPRRRVPPPTSATPRVIVGPRAPGPPRVAEVRAALRGLAPEVQRCADTHEPWDGAGPRPRLRLRVWLEPDGRHTLEVPELAGRTDASAAPRARLNLARLHACLAAQVTRVVRPHLRPFPGRRQKIEHAYRLAVPGPPPAPEELARRVVARRGALLACIPGAGASGEPAELVVRARLAPDGSVRLTGLLVPASVPFEPAARCVSDRVGLLSGPRVTGPQDFEAVLRYRFTPAAAPPPE
ncbi:MAG: hypothetical protein KF729_19875 [Sandaracinaceae bacterium]|nr:hypothetical protein [Sandaracinaceae bacterium]